MRNLRTKKIAEALEPIFALGFLPRKAYKQDEVALLLLGFIEWEGDWTDVFIVHLMDTREPILTIVAGLWKNTDVSFLRKRTTSNLPEHEKIEMVESN